MAKKTQQNAPEPVDEPVTEPTPVPVASTNAASIAETLADEMPEPSPNAIAEKVTDAPAQTVSEPSPVPASRGRGRPKLSDEEKAKRATTRKSKIGTIPKGEVPNNVADATHDATAAIALAAGTATSLTIMLGCMIGGSDFAPEKNALAGGMTDDKFLYQAYFDYCKAKGVSDIPPGVALTAAIMVYVAPRLNKPTTQSRLQKVGGFFIGAWKKFRNRKNNRTILNAAYVDRGNDRERQDNARPQAVGPV